MIFIDFWDTKGLWIAPKRSGSTTSSPLTPFCPSQPLGKHTGHTASSEPSLEASYPQGFWDSQHIRSTSVSVSPIPSSNPTHPWTSCASKAKGFLAVSRCKKIAYFHQPAKPVVSTNPASRVAAPANDDGFFPHPTVAQITDHSMENSVELRNLFVSLQQKSYKNVKNDMKNDMLHRFHFQFKVFSWPSQAAGCLVATTFAPQLIGGFDSVRWRKIENKRVWYFIYPNCT